MTEKKGAGPAGAAARAVAAEPVRAAAGGLLQPVADDEALVAAFRRYVQLKEKLLDPTDYVWSVCHGDERRFFRSDADAKSYAEALSKKGLKAEIEKKIKKSGALKLGKAFGVSVEVIERSSDGTEFYFRVRATAANGQYQERTGRCSKTERGKQSMPPDSIEATALTRASNRAIMALLGGETTAEEFDGGVEGDGMSGAAAPAERGAPQPPSHEESVEEIKRFFDEKFSSAKPAGDERQKLLRTIFALAREAGISEERLKEGIRSKYKVSSIRDLDESALTAVVKSLEKKIERKGD